MRLSNGKWQYARHLRLLNEAFLKIAAGEIRRLIVNMPPRHGKSEFLSKYCPAWYLGTFPDKRIIQCGYGDDFAKNWGGKVKNALTEANQLGIFPVRVRSDKRAADEWDIEGHDGGLIASGVGGAITGYGAHLLCIDDPIKSRENADSKTKRDTVWDWYRNDAYTRLEPGGAIVLVNTRWHIDDLSGRLLSGMNDDDRHPWTVINIPAFAEDNDLLGREIGEALWPERYPAEELHSIEKSIGSYAFASLFQQKPIQRTGGMFKPEWFRIIDTAPAGGRMIRFWDLAGTEGDGDWTAGPKLAAYENGSYIVLDVRRDRLSPSGVRNLVLATAQLDGYNCMVGMFQDPGQAGKDQAQEYSRILAGYPLFVMSASGNPDLRAESFAAQCEAGNVSLLRGPWNEAFIDELCNFTTKSSGGVDDQVDGISGGFAQLTREADEYSTYLSAEEIIPGFAPVRLGAA